MVMAVFTLTAALPRREAASLPDLRLLGIRALFTGQRLSEAHFQSTADSADRESGFCFNF